MATTCPCLWTDNFGGGVNGCEPQTPGVSSTVIVFCRDELDVDYVPCDPLNPTTTGRIRDLVKLAAPDTVNGRFFQVATNNNGEGFLNIVGTETVNDNGGKDRNETLTGQGFLSPENQCWMEAMLNKEIIIVAEDNEGGIGVWGWNGGLRLTEWGYAIGQNAGDFKGINFTFTNGTRDLFKYIDLTLAGLYTSYEELETYLTTT